MSALTCAFALAGLLVFANAVPAQKPPQVMASDCENCRRTCAGTCVKQGDTCFCFSRLEPDPQKLEHMDVEDPGLKVRREGQPGSRPGR